MIYNIEVKRNKSVAKCRQCRKVIPNDTLCMLVSMGDGFHNFSGFSHANCVVTFLVKEIKKDKLEELRKESLKFEKIDKILNGD